MTKSKSHGALVEFIGGEERIRIGDMVKVSNNKVVELSTQRILKLERCIGQQEVLGLIN